MVGAVILARRPKGELAPIPEVEPAWPMRPEPSPDAEVTSDVDDADLEADDDASDEAGDESEEASA